jgi:uncharacterized protein (DUF488 family)
VAPESNVVSDPTPPDAARDPDRTVWTVGHSRRELDELVDLLRSAGVERAVDVRSYPRSRFPWFHGDALAAGLARRDIDYVWLGRELGGLRRDGYTEWMRSDEFAAGLETLERLAVERRVAVCCAERDPVRCHRRFIADALVDRGWRIVHLLGSNETVEHVRTPRQDELPFG